MNSTFLLRVLFSRHSPFRAVIYLFYGDFLTVLFCSFTMMGKSFDFSNIKVHLLTLVQWYCDMLELQSLMVLLMTCSSWAQSKAANEPEPLCESLWEIWTIDHESSHLKIEILSLFSHSKFKTYMNLICGTQKKKVATQALKYRAPRGEIWDVIKKCIMLCYALCAHKVFVFSHS